MPYNYATEFGDVLAQKYEAEQKSWALFNSNPGIEWMDYKTLKVPYITTSGYKNHARTGAFNAGTLTNDYQTLTLSHDRDVEFFIDTMDADETKRALQVARTSWPLPGPPTPPCCPLLTSSRPSTTS